MQIQSEQGLIDVELEEGCGMCEVGLSLRVNGICVFHFTAHANILKVDIFSSAARIAGIRWTDYPEGGFHQEGGVHVESDER